MYPTKTEAISNLLTHITHADLASLYNNGMEVQVTVRKGEGIQIQQEYKGKNYVAYTDNVTTWKPFRIPWNAATEPTFEDRPMQFDLAEHYEGIGMTGWNWQLKKSIYVAFDFDSIIGHKTGLDVQTLEEIRQRAIDIPWVTLRRSTSGSGYHIYVFLHDLTTVNHTEHAAVARAILAKLSSVTGYDFRGKVDTCGGNMWIAHRKMRFGEADSNGLILLKQGTPLVDIPLNWRDHMSVVTRKAHKVKLEIEGTDQTELDKLMDQRLYVPLEESHLQVVKELEGTDSWWDNDHHLLVTHTWSLLQLHERLNLRGPFRTVATGKDGGNDHNAYLTPLRGGGWLVRRFTRNCLEDPLWFQDKAGWTCCYFNRHPDLETASRAFGGVEKEKGGFVFSEASVALEALSLLGAYIDVPMRYLGRLMQLKENKDGRLVVKMKYEPGDGNEGLTGWVLEGKFWTRIVNAPLKAPTETEINDYDQIVRHLVNSDDSDAGWVLKSEERWVTEPLAHVKLALGALGYNTMDVNAITGSNITKAWKLIIKPFGPEYPGNRLWNRSAPQFKYTPTENKDNLKYPTWNAILQHCGENLTEAVWENEWCRAAGITNGADYLRCWCASLFQEPLQPLPYLFFYGPQNSGKSIFHEALSTLFSPGYVRADISLTSPSAFNGELENAVLCIVEETDLKANKTAYNRIKDWVTSVLLPIHTKMKTPTHVPNTTHWVQIANDEKACPIFPGDTRIVMVKVNDLETVIPKKHIFESLNNEAADFLASLLSLELPPTNDRLNIPVILTSDKLAVEESNKTELELFLEENVYYVAGQTITVADFYQAFVDSLDPSQIGRWPKPRVSKELPREKFPKARLRNATWAYGNMSFDKRRTPTRTLYRPMNSEFFAERDDSYVDRFSIDLDPKFESDNSGE